MSAVESDLLRRIDALAAQGQPAAARALAQQSLQQGSSSLPLHFRLAALLLKAGEYRQALEVTLGAARHPPRQPAELVELAKRLMYFNQAGVLRGLAGTLLAAPLWHAAAEADFAALLSMVGEQELAGRLLDRAMAVLGPTPPTLYNRSQMHLYSGRMAQAEADLQHCLRMEPGSAKAHWALSKLPRAPATEPELAQLAALAARAPAGSQDEAFLRFARFNRLDPLGQADVAWTELARGCAVKRKLVNYDATATLAFFDAMIAAFPASAAVAASADTPPATTSSTAADADAPGEAAPTPVFIVGMHRSGTTLLERMLGNHSQVSEGGELYDFPAQLRWAIGRHFAGPSDPVLLQHLDRIDFAEVGRRYLAQVRWRARGRRLLVDKLPSNFINTGFIHRALPQARVIHMRRSPMDTCFSNLKELFSNACAYSYDQLELADYYAGHHRLMRHWQRVAPGFVLEVSYEALARDPRAEAERILAFCGLDWEPACIDLGSNTRAVNTASSAQVREPIHQRSIEAWRRYEAPLAPMARRLAEHGLI